MSASAEQNRRLTDHVKSVISLDKDTGVVGNTTDLYHDPAMLAEGVTSDDLHAAQKVVKNHDTTFIAATSRAITEIARDAYGDDKFKADTVTGNFPMYQKDAVTISANRDGTADISVLNRAADPSVGQLKIALKEYRDSAKKAQEE